MTDAAVVDRALAFVAEFQGDKRCSLNCFYSEALAAEVVRLRAERERYDNALCIACAKDLCVESEQLTKKVELIAAWRKRAARDHETATGDDSGGIWAYQHEAAGRARAFRQCADELEAALDVPADDSSTVSTPKPP